MKTIVLRNADSSIFVEIKVDMLDTGGDRLTIMTIEDSSDSDGAVPELKQLPNGVTEMKEFAISKSLLMDIVETDPNVPTKNIVTAEDLA